MLNLGPIRYASVMVPDGGPVEGLAITRIRVAGEERYQATATLGKELRLPIGERQVFGAVDGCGTDRSALLARYKAISEALERWAYHESYGSGQGESCGLDLDPTSSGMAAYPGLWRRQARSRARAEAAERYCLVNWWSGRLDHRRLPALPWPAEGLEISNPLTRHRVVLLWRQTATGHQAYGFASGRNIRDAAWRALIEMERSVVALEVFHRGHPGYTADKLDGLVNELERRVVYFSLPDGRREFLARQNGKAAAPSPAPRAAVFDREVTGPWTRYATVWRVIYPCETRDHYDPGKLCFFW